MNDKGTLYDKVWADDILGLVESKYSIKLDAHCIKMKKKIAVVGESNVSYKYKEIDKNILLIVKWEEVKSKKEEKKEVVEEKEVEEAK